MKTLDDNNLDQPGTGTPDELHLTMPAIVSIPLPLKYDVWAFILSFIDIVHYQACLHVLLACSKGHFRVCFFILLCYTAFGSSLLLAFQYFMTVLPTKQNAT